MTWYCWDTETFKLERITDVEPEGECHTPSPPPDCRTVPPDCWVAWGGEAWEIRDNSGIREPQAAPQTETPIITSPTVSPVEFKLLWTSPERIAIKTLKSTDVTIADLFEIMGDPRLETVNLSLQSTQDAVDYILAKLAEGGTILSDTVPARRAAILSGVIQ